MLVACCACRVGGSVAVGGGLLAARVGGDVLRDSGGEGTTNMLEQ
jgi:hypothetical protein